MSQLLLSRTARFGGNFGCRAVGHWVHVGISADQSHLLSALQVLPARDKGLSQSLPSGGMSHVTKQELNTAPEAAVTVTFLQDKSCLCYHMSKWYQGIHYMEMQ